MKKILVKDQLGNIIEYPQPKHPNKKEDEQEEKQEQDWIESSTMPDLFQLLDN